MSQIDELSAFLDDDIVAEYLAQHPDFFNRQPHLLNTLNLPVEGNGTVSLVQRQQTMMRQKIASLEDEITSLMAMASQNQMLYQKFAKLFYKLLACEEISGFTDTINQYFIQELNLDKLNLVLFAQQPRSQFENLIIQRLGKSNHYFGRINQQEQKLLFAEHIEGSVAVIALGKHGEQGLLVTASRDANHFHPQMDDLMLTQLCRMVSVLIQRL